MTLILPRFESLHHTRHETDGDLTYFYDGLNRLIQRGGDKILYADQANDPVSVAGELIARDLAGAPLSTSTGGSAGLVAIADQHGDVIAGLDPATGAITGSRTYAPFGEVSEEDGTTGSLGYQGEYTDPETGRVNMHARWYDPATGGFSSRDSWTLNPVPSVQANRYTYANGSPLNFTDPSGHAVICPPKTPCPVKPTKPVPAPRVGQYVKKGAFTLGRGAIRAGIRIIGGALGGVILDDIIFAEHLADGTCGGPCNWIPPTPWQPPGWGMGGVGVRAGKGFCRSCYGVKPPWGPSPSGGGYYWDGDGGGFGVAAPPPPPPWKAILAAVLATEHARPVTEMGADAEHETFANDSLTRSIKELALEDPIDINDFYFDLKWDFDLMWVFNTTPTLESLNGNGDLEYECERNRKIYAPLTGPHGMRSNGGLALYCNTEGLDGGTRANGSIWPEGWPQYGHRVDKSLNNKYPFNRCHYIPRQAGGSGDIRENLSTCHRNANEAMQKYEDRMVNSVRSGEIVVYMNTAVYTTEEPSMPAYYHIEAAGNRGLYVDVCIPNNRHPVVLPGSYCDYVRYRSPEGADFW